MTRPIYLKCSDKLARWLGFSTESVSHLSRDQFEGLVRSGSVMVLDNLAAVPMVWRIDPDASRRA